jgi:hypothetical protein
LQNEIGDLNQALQAVNNSESASTAVWAAGTVALLLAILGIGMAAAPNTLGLSLVIALVVAFALLLVAIISFMVALAWDWQTSWDARAALRREIRDINRVLHGQDGKSGLYGLARDLQRQQWQPVTG